MHPFRHFLTITRHRHKVMILCFRLGIGFQGLFHDLSKYSWTEFKAGARYYQGTRSPNDREREVKGYSSAWMHHKGRNKHHFEYWTDIDKKTNLYLPVKMPLKYVKEMFADRLSATMVYKGKAFRNEDPWNYYTERESGLKMHPDTAELLESWLRMLKEKGMKETLKTIKAFKEEDYGKNRSEMSDLQSDQLRR